MEFHSGAPISSRRFFTIDSRTLSWSRKMTNLSSVAPRKRLVLKAVILAGLVVISLSSSGIVRQVFAGSRTSSIDSAITWLVGHELSDGSYGFYSAPQTAPAANAMWIRSGNPPNVQLSYTWLSSELENSSTWFWGGSNGLAEADIPGEVLYSLVTSQHLGEISLSIVGPRLLNLQQSNGGFLGYLDPKLNQQVTSSVDTAEALRGLIDARAIKPSSQQSAINYLFSLQNSDGSFNLTRTVASDALYSLGPEPISMTALVLLVLKDASFTANDPHVSSALHFLSLAAGANFNGHVYAASLATLALTQFDRASDATVAVNFILSHQNSDGGFRDTARSSTGSNALDTGWATVALELGGLFGDTNLDGVVDIIDLSAVGASYGSAPGTSRWNPRADVDANGMINIVDLVLVANAFSKKADSL